MNGNDIYGEHCRCKLYRSKIRTTAFCYNISYKNVGSDDANLLGGSWLEKIALYSGVIFIAVEHHILNVIAV